MAIEKPDFPVSEMKLVLHACDPKEPLVPGDKRYEDFTDLRRGEGIEDLKIELEQVGDPGSYHHLPLCGHRGCGKSTEMLSLKQWADENDFLADHAEVDVHFGLIELEFSDMCLLAASRAEAAMAESGHPLPEEKIRGVVQWFSEIIEVDKDETKSELAMEAGAQLGGGLPLGLGKLFAKFTAGVKAGSEHATTTRRRIRNLPDTLIDKTNDLLDTANEILAGNGKPRGLLLLFDNLDRYPPERIDKVLFEGSDLVRKLKAHAVFTFPISLEYAPLSGPIHDKFGFSSVVPMLALRQKNSTWAGSIAESAYSEDAVGRMRKVLDRRIDLDKLFDDPEDADWLIKMSGGCIRDLIHLISLAFRYARGADKFSRDILERGVARMRSTYVVQLDTEKYERLAEIAHRRPVNRDQLTNDLLFNRYALEYRDDRNQPWLDVHPVVIEIEDFQRVFNEQRTIQAD